VLDECERSLHDVLCVVLAAKQYKLLIGGGCAAHIEIAKRVRQEASKTSSVIQLCLEAFAASLESMMMILAENGGWDTVDMLAKCRRHHQDPEGVWFGIDVENGSVTDMVHTLHVLEPARVLESVLKGAVDTAEIILRVDINVLMKPATPFNPVSNYFGVWCVTFASTADQLSLIS
jgi:chaperonin GroEL (HSP60 family)